MSSDPVARTATRVPQPEPPVSAGPAFELLESKLRRPVLRRTAVPRTEPVHQLNGSRDNPIVAIIAAPGYGKTTVLTQWAEADPRPFACVGLDKRDNDAVVLLTYIAEASPQGAARVQKRIQHVIDLLLAHPEIGLRTDDPDIRRLTTTPYPFLVFYEIGSEEIIIHAIRHGGRDPGGMPGSHRSI